MARRVGRRQSAARDDLSEAEKFAVALQATIEVMEGIGLTLAEGEAGTEG